MAQKRTNGKRLTPQDDEMIAQLYRMGKSINEISDFTGFTWGTIKTHLVAMGVIDGAKDGEDNGMDEVVSVLTSIDGHLASIAEALALMAEPPYEADECGE